MKNAISTYDFLGGDNPIFDRISLQELGYLLDYQTATSVKNWCDRHSVTIHRDGQKRFIYKCDYARINTSLLIKDLKEKYKDNWEVAFEMAKHNELYKMDQTPTAKSIHSIPRYKAKSPGAKKLINRQ